MAVTPGSIFGLLQLPWMNLVPEVHICPCSNTQASQGPPAFVGENYFCDSGNPVMFAESLRGRFFPSSPLWDGAGCGPDSTCCSFNSPPWFYKELPSPTSDAMEMRVCSYEPRSNEDVAVSLVELYVQ